MSNPIALRLHEMQLQLEGLGLDEIVAALGVAEREIERQQELLTPEPAGTFEERKRTTETGTIEDYYICGCGGELWILLKNGDCVCPDCMTAQARIIVKELAPVGRKPG